MLYKKTPPGYAGMTYLGFAGAFDNGTIGDMTFMHIVNVIGAAIGNIGWLLFIVLLIIDALLWKIHPALGILGALVIFALLMGWI